MFQAARGDLRRMRRIGVLLTFGLLAGLVSTELLLRALGRLNHPLFEADPQYEYLMRPDQDVRYGRIHYVTNALGLRSPPIGPKRGRRVLIIGDSVINGGQQTTQDSLATEQAARRTGVELINLSAGSWGTENAMAWIRAHGLMQADALIIVLSSHDAYDRMTFEPVVGHHPSYPAERPQLALSAELDRWTHRRRDRRAVSDRTFASGWRALRDTAVVRGLQLTVVLHPELGELAMGRYDVRGARILDSLTTWNVAVVTTIDRMDSAMYTDRIHLNDRGQAALADVLVEVIDRSTPANTFGHDPSSPTR